MGLDFAFGEEENPQEEKPETALAILDITAVRPQFEDFKKEAEKIAAQAVALVVVDEKSLTLAAEIGGGAKRIIKAIENRRDQVIEKPDNFVKSIRGMCKSITDDLKKATQVAGEKVSQHQAKIELERRQKEEAARKAAKELQERLDREAAEANRKAREEAIKKAEEETRARLAKEAEERAKQEKENKKAREEREKREAEEMAEARRLAEEEAKKHEIESPQVMAPVLPKEKNIVRTEEGSAHQRKKWTFDKENVDLKLLPEKYIIKSFNKKLIQEDIDQGLRNPEIPGVNIIEESKTVFRS